MSKLAAADALVTDQGFEIFPIAAGKKAPPIWKDWPTKAEPSSIWWELSPQDNIGIHCKGLVVIDVDPRKGGDESIQFLDITEGVPSTLTTRTPTGGRHLFFRLPAGQDGTGNSVGALGDGLDIRSAGGYVVAPGSTVAAGTYEFVDPSAPIADAPQWLLDRLGTARKPAAEPARDIIDADESLVHRAGAWLAGRPPAVEGEGGDAWTFATACAVRDMGVSERQALALLREWNLRCLPPWPDDALATKVRNAYKYAENEAGSRAAMPSDFPVLPVQESAARERESLMRLADFAAQKTGGAGYVVKGFLQRASYAEVYGAPGEGKTFVALDMGYHVAAGRDWMGHKVAGGPVLHLAFEGRGGLIARAKALRQQYGDADVPLYVSGAAFSITTLEGRALLGELIAQMPEKPALIVFDTFAKALMGGDENSAQDVGAFNLAVEALIQSTGACVLIVHHSGKDPTKGARGSSALLGALDTEIEVSGGQVRATKQRDVELGEPIGFKLKPIVVGIDEDGDETTSCVVEPAAVTPGVKKLSGNARRGFDMLCEISPQNDPVLVDVWRDACVKEFLSKSRSSFHDLKKQLESKGFINVDALDRVTRRMT